MGLGKWSSCDQLFALAVCDSSVWVAQEAGLVLVVERLPAARGLERWRA